MSKSQRWTPGKRPRMSNCSATDRQTRGRGPRYNDVAATRLVFEAAGSPTDKRPRPRASRIDPDGHHLVIVESPETAPPSQMPARAGIRQTGVPPDDRANRTESAVSTAPPVTVYKVLTGQKALVTGANSGIGKGRRDCIGTGRRDVVVNYVEGDDAAHAVVDEIVKSGVRAYAHKADVSAEDQVKAMFGRMMQQFGTIDVLVEQCRLAARLGIP